MRPQRKDFAVTDDSFTIVPFWKTLSYREFLTAMALALMIYSLSDVIEYFKHGWIANNRNLLASTATILAVIVGHVLYRIEHRRYNKYLGRCAQDCLTFFAVFVIGRIREMIDGSFIEMSSGEVVSKFILGIFLILSCEIIFSVLNRLLLYVAWRRL